MSLPPAMDRPCHECPWRRGSAPGWLGPLSPEEWVELARSESPIACHLTIPEGSREGSWDDDKTLQCRGAATYRANVGKLPRDPSDAACKSSPDKDRVFASADEFLAWHVPWSRRRVTYFHEVVERAIDEAAQKLEKELDLPEGVRVEWNTESIADRR